VSSVLRVDILVRNASAFIFVFLLKLRPVHSDLFMLNSDFRFVAEQKLKHLLKLIDIERVKSDGFAIIPVFIPFLIV
jgi:hypothetical protein